MEQKYLIELTEKLSSDPVARAMGIRVEEVGPGTARMAMTLREDMINFMGSAHGGAVFTLADHAFAAAANSGDRQAVALSVSISYLSAGSAGEVLVAEAQEVSVSRRTGVYRIDVRTEEGRPVAAFQGVVYRKGAG